MKILKKIFQSIFRTSVLSLLIAASPFENHADNKVATILNHCIEEDHTVKPTISQAKQADKKEQAQQTKQAKQIDPSNNHKQTDPPKKVPLEKEAENEEDVEEFSVPVYVTRTGKCFHKDNSACVKHSKIKIPLDEAISNHYVKCSKCFG